MSIQVSLVVSMALLLGFGLGVVWSTRQHLIERVSEKERDQRLRGLKRAWDHQQNIGRRIENALTGWCTKGWIAGFPVVNENPDPTKTYRYYRVKLFTHLNLPPGTALKNLVYIDVHVLSEEGPHIEWTDLTQTPSVMTRYSVDDESVQAVIEKARAFMSGRW